MFDPPQGALFAPDELQQRNSKGVERQECSLIHGDCLDVLAMLPPESVDLVYLDPPYFTQQRWTGKAGSFDDRWPDLSAYIGFMHDRLRACHRVLRPGGTIYVQCDQHAWAELRILLDVVFAPWSWRASICWKRSSGQTATKKAFGQSHDTIHVYVRGDERRHGLNVRRCNLVVTWNPQGGEADTDCWTDHGLWLTSQSRERVGYPTQKPAALLERIIQASSNPGDLVLDPFCGSGTTCVVADRLGRRWIGIDASEDAILVTKERLAS